MKPRGRLDTGHALAILEAAYSLDRDDASWLTELSDAVAPAFDRGLGVAGYYVEVGGPGEFRGWGHTGQTEVDVPRMWRDVLRRAGTEYLRQIHISAPFGTTDQPSIIAVRGYGEGSAVMRAHQCSSAAGLMGIGADGYGVAMATWAPADRPHAPRGGELAFWSRVAPHLATAARLRRMLAQRADRERAAAAVLAPGGRLLHAEVDASASLAREALREAVVQLDRARARPRGRDAREALELWRCMVHRRWTLVDHFERGGRRFVLAYTNEPTPRAIDALSARERAVAAAAALGHGNKVIAYELGLAESTVATLLGRAKRKLGVSSRVGLVRRVREATSGTDAGQP